MYSIRSSAYDHGIHSCQQTTSIALYLQRFDVAYPCTIFRHRKATIAYQISSLTLALMSSSPHGLMSSLLTGDVRPLQRRSCYCHASGVAFMAAMQRELSPDAPFWRVIAEDYPKLVWSADHGTSAVFIAVGKPLNF